jgi:integrase
MNDTVFEQYKDYVRGRYPKERTRENYIDNPRIMLQWLGKTTIDLTQNDISTYYEYCYKTKKINGNALRFWAIKHYLEWASRIDLRVPKISPVDAGKQALNEENLNRLHDAVENLSPLYRLVFYLEIDTLRRPSEIREIKINDRYGNILSYEGKTKNHHGRQKCVMTDRLLHAWDDYLKVRPPPKYPTDKDYLILSDYCRHKGKHLTTNTVLTRVIRELSMIAGIDVPFGEHPTNYLIKRTGITRQLKECPDPKIIQIQAGHSNLATTMKYNRVNEKDIENYLRSYEYKNKKTKEKLEPADLINIC